MASIESMKNFAINLGEINIPIDEAEKILKMVYKFNGFDCVNISISSLNL